MLPQRIYRVTSPPRVVGCAEYGCANYRNGWRTILPADQADRIRVLRGYSFTEEHRDGGLVAFTFPPGQECFTGRAGMHRLPWEGRERFIERADSRITGNARILRPDDWVDSFANNQIIIAEQVKRG
jgi:hypothetical protein